MPDVTREQAEGEEVPPWHSYCGCFGCRAGNSAARRALRDRLTEEVDDA